MHKKIFTIVFAFLFVFLLTGCGCESNIFKGGKNYHKSPKAVMDRFCYLAENDGTYEQYIELFTKEIGEEMEGIIPEGSDKGDVAEGFAAKKCTYTFVSDMSEEDIQKGEEHLNERFNTNYDILECKNAEVSFDGKVLEEIGACKLKGGKWYIFMG
jgi:hypothetical protein